ncbi:hypothetical protein ACKFKG_13355 [Phormidesmis sp. 146-35]
MNTAIYPGGVVPQTCEVNRHQSVWRIIEGKAQYVDYAIYAEPGNPVVPRCLGCVTAAVSMEWKSS